MKKVAIIFLVSIYAASTFGVSLKEFYCCGKLQSITFYLGDKTTNKCGKGDDKDNCCKTKFQFYKVKDTHFSKDLLNLPARLYTVLPTFNSSFESDIVCFKQRAITHSPHAPPLYNGIPLHIFNCVYRI